MLLRVQLVPSAKFSQSLPRTSGPRLARSLCIQSAADCAFRKQLVSVRGGGDSQQPASGFSRLRGERRGHQSPLLREGRFVVAAFYGVSSLAVEDWWDGEKKTNEKRRRSGLAAAST
eukprot:3090689-Rhodomonas_salina.3